MDHNDGRLVDDEHVVIFVQRREGQGSARGRGDSSGEDGNDVARVHPLGRLAWRSVYGDENLPMSRRA
jgi:hypothetical protein